MTASVRRISWVGLAFLLACGDDEGGLNRDPAAVQGADGAIADASGGDASATVPDAALPVREDSGLVSTHDAAAPQPDAAQSGATCGGIAALRCPKDQFCNQEQEGSQTGCGIADSTGRCEPIPDGCTQQYEPVCGCDDETYGNACEAHAAGVSVAALDACKGRSETSCDDRDGNVLCKKARPKCPEGQVPEVVEHCWGECVLVDRCVCKAADACPERDKYVCHMSAGHCGPYVN